MNHSRLLIARRPPREVVVFGVGAEPQPIADTPTVVSKADVFDYAATLVPIVKSLHNDDILPYLCYMDPNTEHNEVERLLSEAKAIDGCDQGLTCPGWREGETVGSVQEMKAAELRREAFQHRVDARLMEERLDVRTFKTTNAQIKQEVAFFAEWNEWRKRFENFLASAEKAVLLKGSDFEQVRKFDVDLQKFRSRYTELVHRAPTRSYPSRVAESGGFPWGWAILIATLAAGGYFLASAGGLAAALRPAPSPRPLPQGA